MYSHPCTVSIHGEFVRGRPEMRNSDESCGPVMLQFPRSSKVVTRHDHHCVGGFALVRIITLYSGPAPPVGRKRVVLNTTSAPLALFVCVKDAAFHTGRLTGCG